MEIKTFEVGPLSANNYLLTDGDEAVLIDCSGVIPEILEELKGKTLKYILLTHGHFDHVLGINDMKEKTGTEALVHKNDIERIEESAKIMRAYGLDCVLIPRIDDFLEDGQIIKFGNSELKVILTPGHTQGCVCYSIDDKLFSGDTLFKGSCGRCDLPGGDFKQIEKSIKNILFKMDDNVTVYPGHGEATTIGYEKQFNEIL